MNPEPRRLIAALRRSHQRLASLVHAVSEDFLSSRSYRFCRTWAAGVRSRCSRSARRCARSPSTPARSRVSGTPARLRGTGPDVDLLLEVAGPVTLTPWPGDAAAADGAPAPGAATGAPDAEIRMPAEALMRLVYGRLDPAHTPPAEVTGGDDGLGRVRAVFPGF